MRLTVGNEAYKDRLFSFIFGNEAHKDWTLALYNAVNQTRYTNPEDISIETLRQVLYMGMHDDVAFIIADMLSLWEQQSTYNPNMPLRMLEYTANLFEKLIRRNKQNKYGQRLIPLPTPRLAVFYNGTREAPDESTLRLADAFRPEHRNSADIAVNVRMINVNKGHSRAIMEACRPLTEYAWIVDSVRSLRSQGSLEFAIDTTLDRMPEDFQTKPFLEEHKAEVKSMLLTEYNEVETMEMFKREAREEGLMEGRKEGRREGRREGREEGRREGRKEGREEGRDSERLSSIRNIMKSFRLTAQQAMDALGIPAAEQPKYEAMIH